MNKRRKDRGGENQEAQQQPLRLFALSVLLRNELVSKSSLIRAAASAPASAFN